MHLKIEFGFLGIVRTHSAVRKGFCCSSVLTCAVDPAGRVVGILQRNWRDYVVTFPTRDGTQSQSRNFQRILAVPWDRRIPKIRISTQQADALQVGMLYAEAVTRTIPEIR